MSEAISGAGVGGVPDAASLIRATDSSAPLLTVIASAAKQSMVP